MPACRKHFHPASLGFLILGLSIHPGFGDVVTNLVPVADTGLWEANPDNNLGAMLDVPVGTTGLGKRSRALFRFQIDGAISSNAIVTAVTLTLNTKSGQLGGLAHNLHRLLRPWGEGTGTELGGAGSGSHGSPAKANEATWNARFHASVLWTTNGAALGDDYVASPSATAPMKISGSNAFTSATLAADVQAWLNTPGTNFGWILMVADELTLSSALRVLTREDLFNTPVLTVSYTLPTPPARPVISQTALVGSRIRFSFGAESSRAYTVESRSISPPTDWSGLTNVAPLPAPASVTVSDQLTSSNRCYRVRTP